MSDVVERLLADHPLAIDRGALVGDILPCNLAEEAATLIQSLRTQVADLTRERDAYEEEAHQIGRRDGRSETLAEIDRLTGGDGEYRYCTDHGERHCPDEEAMLAKIVARFSGLTRERDEAAEKERAAVDRVTKSIIATGAHQEQSNGPE